MGDEAGPGRYSFGCCVVIARTHAFSLGAMVSSAAALAVRIAACGLCVLSTGGG